MYIIAPSILEADQAKLSEQMQELKRLGVQYVHIDIMDGSFVPNLSGGIAWLRSIRQATDLVFDVHMMVLEPERFADKMKWAGADILTIHYEACHDVQNTLKRIHDLGMRSGLALKPETNLELLTKEVLEKADVVHLMCTSPGIGGTFQKDSIKRIRQIREKLDRFSMTKDIEVDGGINFSNIRDVKIAGANIFVAGRAVFNGELAENISRMKAEIE